MNFHIRYDIQQMCSSIVREQLGRFDIPYEETALGEIRLTEPVSAERLERANASLQRYGIELQCREQATLSDKIKDALKELVYQGDSTGYTKISAYLSARLNHSYGYLANVFSEETRMSIENFFMIHRIEYAKRLIISGRATLSEISYELNYSSPAHFSSQFKKVTGLTPSLFQRIIEKKRKAQACLPEN